MPIVNAHCSDKAYCPDLLEKLRNELGEILARALSVSGAKLNKKNIKIFFSKNGPYDVCDEDLVIHIFANDFEERRASIETNTKDAAEEIQKLIASVSWPDGNPVHGFIYPFMGAGEVGKF